MKKINEKTLLDNWCVSGSDYAEFKETLTELSNCTEFVHVDPVEVSVMSYRTTDEECARFWELCPCNTGSPQTTVLSRKLMLDSVLAQGDHEQLLKDTFNNVGMLFVANGRVFFPAEKVVSRGLVQFGAGGSAMTRPSYERDLYIASLFKHAKTSTFVIREIAGAKKLVSILSARYKAFPQSALCEIIDAIDFKDCGAMTTRLWTIDNWVSNIYVEFPEKADEIKTYYDLKDDFVPGLWLQTSDTGDASVKIFPTWRKGCSISYVEKAAVKKAHSGTVNLETMLANIEKMAFAEYRKMPEAMCDLMAQTLTNPSWDLSNVKDVEKNRKMIESVIKKAFRTLHITKAIGKGNKKELCDQLCMEFSGSAPYTAYDVAASLMSLPGRLDGVHPQTLHNLENAVSEAPYIKYGVSKDDAESEEELILI